MVDVPQVAMCVSSQISEGLLEKEVSQKVSQCHLIYHVLFEVAKNLDDIEVVHASAKDSSTKFPEGLLVEL